MVKIEVGGDALLDVAAAARMAKREGTDHDHGSRKSTVRPPHIRVRPDAGTELLILPKTTLVTLVAAA